MLGQRSQYWYRPEKPEWGGNRGDGNEKNAGSEVVGGYGGGASEDEGVGGRVRRLPVTINLTLLLK